MHKYFHAKFYILPVFSHLEKQNYVKQRLTGSMTKYSHKQSFEKLHIPLHTLKFLPHTLVPHTYTHTYKVTYSIKVK
jgi:hypothetical protein